MPILDDKQADLLEHWVPDPFLKRSDELAFADRALSDPRVFEPFVKSAKRTGRPTIPIATDLRMMYLKFRDRVSDERTAARNLQAGDRSDADGAGWKRPHSRSVGQFFRRRGAADPEGKVVPEDGVWAEGADPGSGDEGS